MAALALLAAPAQAAVEFTIVNLGLYGNNGATALAVNNSGSATGFSTTGLTSTKQAFRYDNSVVSNLHNQGGLLLGGFSGSLGWGINNAGTVVGQALRSNISAYVPFVSVNGGTMTEIHTPLGSGLDGGEARDINNQGQVTGYGNTAAGPQHAFVYNLGTQTGRDLGTLGGTTSHGHAINESGHVVGESFTTGTFNAHAFLHNGTSMTDLGTLGGLTSSALGINDSGLVVGWSMTGLPYPNDRRHAVTWQNGLIHDLGTLLPGTSSEANDVNNAGWVVGTSDYIGDTHAMLWRNGQALDLNTLIAPGSGIVLRTAMGVSDAGHIVGTALLNNTTPITYVMTPVNLLAVPEPGSWALLLAGIGVLGLRSARMRTHARR